MKNFPRRAGLLLLILLLAAVLCACGSEDGNAVAELPADSPSPLSPPSPRPADKHIGVKLYFDSLLSDRGYYENDTLYIAPEAVCAYFDIECSTQSESGNFMLSLPGLELTGSQALPYMEADGRYFYTPTGYLEEDGRIYLPADVVERLFGIKFQFSPEELKAELNNAVLSLLRGGDSYYEINFPQEDLYWLSRIIYAEAKDQPLEGLIGVGNVVYNRVESDEFPHTVLDVIYDRDKTIQFDPTAGGALGEPDERSVIAACLCMEGYNTVGDCLYFVNPDRGDSTWFENELEFVVSLGDHDFYRSGKDA